MKREAVEKFYRVTLDYRDKHSPHSWRSAFSTLAHDSEFDHAVIEAHLDKGRGQVATVLDALQPAPFGSQCEQPVEPAGHGVLVVAALRLVVCQRHSGIPFFRSVARAFFTARTSDAEHGIVVINRLFQ